MGLIPLSANVKGEGFGSVKPRHNAVEIAWEGDELSQDKQVSTGLHT